MQKKLLIITYYWPPSAGGGVQRWLKFAKYLPDNGWTPIIYTPENPDYGLMDESMDQDIAADLTVLKTPIWEPYGLAKIFRKSKKGISNAGKVDNKGLKNKLLSWIRGNLFIPDPRKFWVKPSTRYLTEHLKTHPVDAIVTTGPPHSMHLIGLALKKELGLPWIVDIRDPWSGFDMLDKYHVSRANRHKYAAMEKEVLTRCDKVLATSPSMPDLLQPFDHEKFECITNGYDNDDFPSIPSTPPSTTTIYHAGLLNELRNPTHFWSALASMAERRKALHLHLAGVVESSVQADLLAHSALKDKVTLQGYKPHEEVLLDYQKAAYLLLLVNNTANAKVNIPGKTFEYLATGKPIICISDKEADVVKILSDLDHVLVLSYDESAELIQDKLTTFMAKDFSSVTGAKDMKKYSRSELTARLVRALNGMTTQKVS